MTADQSQATYAAEDLWYNVEPLARTRFGDWNEIWPFYYSLSRRCRDHGMGDITPPTVKRRPGALKAHYDPTTATVFIPPYDKGGVWALNTATAIHEFAHHIAPDAHHGPKFRAAMVDCVEALGWDSELLKDCYSDAGLTTSEEDDGILAHISLIYAQADAPGRTVEEQQAFLERAQKLATRHQIDLAILRKRQGDAKGEDRERPTTGKLFSLTAITNRTHRNLTVELACAIGHAHGAQSTIRGRSEYMTFYGFPEDIALTELMITRVTPMMFEAADEYVKSAERKASGVAAVSARISFCKSFADEVGYRLREAVRQSTEEAVAEEKEVLALTDGNTETGTELALREKEMEVLDYVAHEFKKAGVRGSWRGSRTSSPSWGAIDAGRSAAKQADLFGRKELTR